MGGLKLKKKKKWTGAGQSGSLSKQENKWGEKERKRSWKGLVVGGAGWGDSGLFRAASSNFASRLHPQISPKL